MKATPIVQVFCALAGASILAMQVWKYAHGELALTVSEALVTLMACVLMFAPKSIAEAGQNLLNRKTKRDE